MSKKLSRRDFLKNAAAASAGFAALGLFGQSAKAEGGDKYTPGTYTATAQGKKKVSLEIQSLLNAFIAERKPRIWLYTANFSKRQTAIGKYVLYTIQQATAFGAIAAIYQHYAGTAVFFDFFWGFVFSTFAENNFCWAAVFEALHIICLLFYVAVCYAGSPPGAPTLAFINRYISVH